jgi:chemotaxis protein MotB
MADDPQPVCEECEEGTPAWMVTFADLATLLLCFFVLLLSFSQMDTAKFKELRGSLEKAFGVQRVLPAYEMPKGMKIVARDFDQVFIQQPSVGTSSNNTLSPEVNQALLEEEKELAALLEKLAEQGIAEVGVDEHGRIVMRLLGQTTFDLGSTTIKTSMVPVLDTIGQTIGRTERDILVSGHTDNLPLKGGPHGSNLGLSAARAASVVEFFLQRGHVRPEKIATMAFGEYRPLVPNDSPANREKNRRVEIVLSAIKLPHPSQSDQMRQK